MSAAPDLLPRDEHNRALLANVHPSDWTNPVPAGRYNLVVLGAGTAGLVSAAGAAGVGAKVALIEKNLMGGDCLNVGCVPSKALLRSAHAFSEVNDAGRFGVEVPGGTRVDFGAVMERMREVRARISPLDSAERFRDELGIDVFFGAGRFVANDQIEVEGQRLEFARAVIATGARALGPPIPGLAEAGYLTNETVFELTELPRRLLVVGGGPIGCELSQAFRRFGSEVTLVEMGPQFLPREDPDAAQTLLEAFRNDGIDVRCSTKLVAVEGSGDEKRATLEGPDGTQQTLAADAILIGVGRAPNVDGIGLQDAGVVYEPSGVEVDDRLRTTNRRIYACGDVCMKHKFTHAADFAARAVIQNALFFGREKLSSLQVPWCTYTDPEIAHVGLYAREAAEQGIEIDTYLQEFADIDRAIAEGAEQGFVKIHTRKGKDEIVGATIVNRHAGEMISEISVAMAAGMGLGRLAKVIHPYPTQAEAIRKLGDAYNRTRLTPTVARLFERILAWRR
jgi:pyruvate/2-oxoglutarate dehydrogenase complex dihydrolipoamide dehydrogenase (E3) component